MIAGARQPQPGEELRRRAVAGQGVAHQAQHAGPLLRLLAPEVLALRRIGAPVIEQGLAVQRAAVPGPVAVDGTTRFDWDGKDLVAVAAPVPSRVMAPVSAVVPSPAVAAVPTSVADTPPRVSPEEAAVVPPAVPS